MKNNQITSFHFKKLLTCQKFFVWNNLKLKQDFDDELSFEQEIESDLFFDELDINSNEINAHINNIVKIQFYEFINKTFTNIKINTLKNNEQAFEQTINWLKGNDKNIIIYPFFQFEYKGHSIISRPTIYDCQTKSIYFLKLSCSTKRIDLTKIVFDYSILEYLKIKVKNVFIITLAVKDYLKKQELSFYISEYINSNKNSFSRKKTNFESIEQLQYWKVRGNNPDKEVRLINVAKDKILKIGKFKEFYFNDLIQNLDYIIAAKSKTDLEYPSQLDKQIMGPNPDFNQIINLKMPSIFHNFNLKFFTKKPIFHFDEFKQLLDLHENFNYFNQKNLVLINEFNLDKIYKNYLFILENNKVLWFDFEAISLPFPVLEHTLPYQQVVSQISIIVTDRMQEIKKQNIVFDPKNFKIQNFITIFLVLNLGNPNYYVVYNKSYELTKLKEMINYIKQYQSESFEKVNLIYLNIKAKTIDLWDLFKMNSIKKLPLIFIPSFKGKSSIKLVEKFINNNFQNLEYQIKKYNELSVSNGLVAMQISSARYLNVIGDNQWNDVKDNLAIYCENDVRAMIQIYYLIKKILEIAKTTTINGQKYKIV